MDVIIETMNALRTALLCLGFSGTFCGAWRGSVKARIQPNLRIRRSRRRKYEGMLSRSYPPPPVLAHR